MVAQQAVVNLTLEVGNVEQQVTVTAEAPMVNTTLSSTSGLVGEKEVKDLPLNGRSFDQLLTLNVGTANYTSDHQLAHHNGNFFSVAGRRPEENRFLMNGVDYMGRILQSSYTRPEPAGNCWAWMRCGNSTLSSTPMAPSMGSGPAGRSVL